LSTASHKDVHCHLDQGATVTALCHIFLRDSAGGAVVTNLQAFLLGAMVAWTPSVVILTWLVLRSPLDVDHESVADSQLH
jgi:hypothetical protein